MDLENISKFAPLIPLAVMLPFSVYHLIKTINNYIIKRNSYEFQALQTQQNWREIEQRNKEKYSRIFERRA